MRDESDDPVVTSIRDGVAVVELNRPAKFNCLSSALLARLDLALSQCEANPRVRVVLLRGRGKHFCTGADLDEVLEARKDRARMAQFLGAGHRVFDRFEASRLPVVAAVSGLCLAGGLELMLACDVAFAAASAQIGCQHAQYGLVPGFGGTQRLARLVGLRRALDLMFSGRWLKAPEAAAWGLVNTVADDDALAHEAEAYCARLATRNPEGIALMKRLARAGFDDALAAGLALERDRATDALMSENVTEGLAAFRERREPTFGPPM